MTEDKKETPTINFEALRTGLYEVVSGEVTQYVWMLKGSTIITVLVPKEEEHVNL